MMTNDDVPEEIRRHVRERLRRDPYYYERRTEALIPAVPPRPQPRRIWRPAPFRRFVTSYNNARAALAPMTYKACGVIFPDGQTVLWHPTNGFIDMHRDITAMRRAYLRYGDFNVWFYEDGETPGQ